MPVSSTRQPAERGHETERSQQAPAATPRSGAYQILSALELQSAIGNRGTLRLLAKLAATASPSVGDEGRTAIDAAASPKLVVSTPDDSLEQEADRIAEQVIRAPATEPPHVTPTPLQLSAKCAACEQSEAAATSSTAAQSAAGPTSAIVDQALSKPGEPLDAAARAFFEPRFGRDLAPVRIHADAQAAASAKLLGAQAYTLGSHIVFDEAQYDSATTTGRQLLAHELAHVVQQSQAGGNLGIQRQPAPPGRGRASTTRSQPPGRVLFVQVDRTANTIDFVTESGTLIYDLQTPTEVPVGGYKFKVAVQGNNLNLTAPGEVTTFSGFRYRIAPGQPNPADLLRREHEVSVMVIESGSGAGASSSGQAPVTPTLVAPPITSIPVIYEAIPLDDNAPGVPGVSGALTGAGLGLHNLAFGDLSWLDSPFSSAYWGPLIPRPGITLERGLNTLPRSLTPPLDTFLANRAPGSPLTWLDRESAFPIEFQPDPASPFTRPFSPSELLSIEGLVGRYNTNPASLSAAELQLLREAARIHIGGSTPTAPISSYSRPGELPSWVLNRKRYIVRVNVDRSAALDVSQPNAFNQGVEALTNVEEAEFLVVGDQSGRIISVQRVGAAETSFARWTARNAVPIRWGGRLLLVASLAYSGYRIANASPEERSTVIGEEVGGQLGGIAGAAAATAGCIALGVATGGIGLLLCGLAGGVIGGGVGSVVGGYLGGKIDEWSAGVAWQMMQSEYRNRWGDQDVPPEVLRNAERIENDPFWGLADY